MKDISIGRSLQSEFSVVPDFRRPDTRFCSHRPAHGSCTSPLCRPKCEFCTRCHYRTTGRRAERAKETLATSRGLCRDIKGGALG